MNTNLNIRLIECSLEDQEKFKKIFSLSTSKGRVYKYTDETTEVQPDIAIVDIDSESYKDQQQKIKAKYPLVQVVSKSNHKSADGGSNHIQSVQGALLATRVLRVLDRVVLPEAEEPTVIEAKIETNTEPKQADEIKSVTVEDSSTQTQDEDAFKVLVVDDSPLMQQALGLELGGVAMNINTEYADSGEQALEMIKSKSYDFIFLDIMMPGIDGYETCTIIRKNAEMKKTPIIMLSAKTSPLDEVKGVMAGCTTYLTKPIKHEDFQALIKRIATWVEDFRKK